MVKIRKKDIVTFFSEYVPSLIDKPVVLKGEIPPIELRKALNKIVTKYRTWDKRKVGTIIKNLENQFKIIIVPITNKFGDIIRFRLYKRMIEE